MGGIQAKRPREIGRTNPREAFKGSRIMTHLSDVLLLPSLAGSLIVIVALAVVARERR